MQQSMPGSYHNKWTENALTRKVEVLDQGSYALPSLHTQTPEKSPMLVSTPGELYWPTMVVESGRSEMLRFRNSGSNYLLLFISPLLESRGLTRGWIESPQSMPFVK